MPSSRWTLASCGSLMAAQAMNLQQIIQRALELHRAGRLAEAEELYLEALRQAPRHPSALHLRGILASQSARPDVAVDLIQQAIAVNPKVADYHRDLGAVLTVLGRPGDAIEAFRRAIALNPRDAKSHSGLADVLQRTDQFGEAIAENRRALALEPTSPALHSNLGVALAAAGQLDEAIASFEKAIQLRQDFAGAYVNLGSALREKDQPDAAIAATQQALRIAPDLAGAWNTLGVALGDKTQFQEAVSAFRRAIELAPGYGGAHLNLAMFHLLLGDFEAGWREHEWRWAANNIPRPFAQPQWDGPDLQGQSIVLYGEQGLGDIIQFVRYVPLVAARGGRVTLISPMPLVGLLGHLPGLDQLIRLDEPRPRFDQQCPLMSLPLIFWHEAKSLAGSAPYLKADAARTEFWAELLAREKRLKIGLAWAGSPKHKNDRRRSIPLSDFAPLAKLNGVVFYSLQKGPAVLQSPPPGLPWVDETARLTDMSDTAALIQNLDLVICVDTAVAHLAGAMGKPVWMLLPFIPDWRWMWKREDSPWYPTMRLFRQPSAGDWAGVLEMVTRELNKTEQN
jgi:tetratricopeptide (TPR) repeat protein